MTYEKELVTWHEARGLPSKNFICGYCGKPIASNLGFRSILRGKLDEIEETIYICHFCLRPTYFDKNGNKFPGSTYGNPVGNIPTEDVELLYDEARNCISFNAFTSSVLCSRKLLMNIAVSKGAGEGSNFTEYVEFLSKKGYVPPDGKEWVDKIRKKGNEANHEINMMSREEAEELIDFIEMLLKIIFEFPARGKKEINDETE